MLVDNLTKYILLHLISSTDVAGVIRHHGKFCDELGLPDHIISNRGSCFTANIFQEFCRLHGIRHTLNFTRHPRANEPVERANQTILLLLLMSSEDHRRWVVKIPEIQYHLNNAFNKITSKIPFKVLHGH